MAKTIEYKNYDIVFHEGYNLWCNMRDYYRVLDENGCMVAIKPTIESAKEFIDRDIKERRNRP